ncbi:hypothetical protein J4447_04690 [Candidatus Pacearchaeota archaeon]|nr:hypothetical protein [Candidatus Pacearchaeota archaeon]
MWAVHLETEARPEGAISVAERYNSKLEKSVKNWRGVYFLNVVGTFGQPLLGVVKYNIGFNSLFNLNRLFDSNSLPDWGYSRSGEAIASAGIAMILGGSLALYSSWRARSNRRQLDQNYKEMFGVEIGAGIQETSVRHMPSQTIEQMA